VFKLAENEDHKTLNYRSLKMRDVSDLIKQINELFESGYKIDEDFAPKDCPKIPIIYNLRFIKEDESKKDDGINSLTKKKDLLEYAKLHDIEVPENVDRPAGIKKYIKENLKG
jgi:hypothetical protein